MSERDMNRLIAMLEERLGMQWSDIVEWLRSQNSLDEIERRLTTGDLGDVVVDIEQAAKKFATDLHGAYTTAGQRQAEWLDAQVPTKLIRFDTASPDIVARAQANTLEQVQGLSDEARSSVRQAIVDASRSGVNPRVTAQRIRDSIGLTPNQDQYLANYRTALESGQYGQALGYELSGGHSDRTIASAQRSGRALTPDEVNTATERFRQNAINYRAEVIARTESLRAAHQGSNDAIQQAIDRGDVDADALTRTWNAAHDRRTRRSHLAMDGQTRAFGEKFRTGGGVELAYPGDPDADPAETVQCRCALSTRMTG